MKDLKYEFIFNDKLLEKGIHKFIPIDFNKTPHLAIAGVSGSGKTVGLKELLFMIARDNDNDVFICDYKGDDDFECLKDAPDFYRYDKVKVGLEIFIERFEARQRGDDESRKGLFLIFDEWAAFIGGLDKKTADYYIKQMSQLLMLGRSFHCHVVLSMQRLSADLFASNRDNLSIVICLGNQSKEVTQMLFAPFKDEVVPDREVSSGYMLVEGSHFYKIRFPHANIKALNDSLSKVFGTGRYNVSAEDSDADGDAKQEPEGSA